MSYETWQAAHYAQRVEDLEPLNMTDKQMLEHSLAKWKGLRTTALRRHELKMEKDSSFQLAVRDQLTGKPYLYIDSDSCVLCKAYLEDARHRCRQCPLYAVRGRPCDTAPYDETSPWDAFADGRDPEPMIKLIEAALEARATSAS